ncbi:hypothetical protein QP162_20820 [Sphingomonas aurantiaca]|uniref:hypothetical protein n=1 Tax=Sphingomonas aurantiaca TaxID=185949 RepID=UPI002FE2115F
MTRGDIRAALHHYDVAMSVPVKSRAMLGNILIAASAEPNVATELAKLLKTQPRWLPEFYQRLMGQGKIPQRWRISQTSWRSTGATLDRPPSSR